MMYKPRKKRELSLRKKLQKRNLLDEGNPVYIPNFQNMDLIEHNRLSLIIRCVNPTVHKVGALVRTLPLIWGLEGKLKGREIGEYCVQFIFQHERELQSVLNRSPWCVHGWAISMDQWTPSPIPAFLNRIPFWIQIRNIPIYLIKKETVDLIVESLGKVEEIELHAKKSSSLEYVRARVWVDVEKPLQFRRQARFASGECVTVEFEYEKLLKVCFNCKRLTHGQKLCPFKTPKKQVDYSTEFDPIRRGKCKLVGGGTANPTESFTRQNKPIPKATTSQSTAMSSKSNKPPNSAKGYGGNVGFRPGQGGKSRVLRKPCVQGPIMSRPMQPVGPMGGMDRSTVDLERNFQQKGLFPSPDTPMQVMHKAERKYRVGIVADEEQAKQRQLRGILNKLTPQNFKKLFVQVRSVEIDNAGTLSGVISQIFEKALMEPIFCEMYADFCLHLSGALPDFNENGENITFKRLLLNNCQEEFERGGEDVKESSRVAGEGQVEQTEEEREEKRLKVRRRMLGNIRLIGELYKKKMLTEKIMHACIQKLLGYDQDPHEENIEALCKLMSTIGVMIDHYKAKVHMDAYFEKMKMLSCKQELSSRVRFMLINAIDLRKNKWQERMKVEGPKKIEEVHRDAAQERQTQANRLSRCTQ